jgi:hypothetical protein
MRVSSVLFPKLMATVALAFGALSPAYAGSVNQGPDPDWLLNLSGSPILDHQVQYTATLTASAAFTDLVFEFRQDGDFLAFSNVSAIDTTANSANLLLNGNFAFGTIGTTSVDSWAYSNPGRVSYGGALSSGCGYLKSNCWYDGAAQGYDSLSQTFATVKDHVYEVNFWLDGGSSGLNYSAVSTNGTGGISGNGANVALFARAALPDLQPPPTAPVPEASTWAMMGVGFAGLGWMGFLRSRKARASA